jgi:sugar lactone lactonase YvrE
LPPPAERGGEAVLTLPAFARNVAHRPAPVSAAAPAASASASDQSDEAVVEPDRASVMAPLLAGLGTLGSKGLAAATEATSPRRHARDEAVARANGSPPPAPPPLDIVEAPNGRAAPDLVGAAALATVTAATAKPTAKASAGGGSPGGSSSSGSGGGPGGSGAGAGSNGTPSSNGTAQAKSRGDDKVGHNGRSANSGDDVPDVTEPMSIAEAKVGPSLIPPSAVPPPPPPPPLSEAKPAPAAAGPLGPAPTTATATGTKNGTAKPGPGPVAAAVPEASRNRRSRRRVLVPAVALSAAVLIPALYFIESADGHDTATADQGASGGVVDLSEVGTRSVNLGTGIDPWSLVDDGDTLWVQSGQAGNAQLHQVDLSSGEVVASVPLPDAGVVGAAVIGDGSLWVSTASVETLKGTVLRLDPSSGEVLDSVELPVWPGRMVFAGGSLWVATVQQPVVEELGARDDAFSSAANGIDRIDPRTNEVVATIPLEAKPVDVQAAGSDILVSTESPDGAALVVIDPMSESEEARLSVPDSIGTDADPQAHGPWMLFASDPYAVRFDVDAEDVAAVAGPGEGIDMVVPNGEQLWEMRGKELTILGLRGDPIASVTIDGLPVAAAAAGEGAAWIAYRPSDSSNVVITRVTAATLVERSGPLATP